MSASLRLSLRGGKRPDGIREAAVEISLDRGGPRHPADAVGVVDLQSQPAAALGGELLGEGQDDALKSCVIEIGADKVQGFVRDRQARHDALRSSLGDTSKVGAAVDPTPAAAPFGGAR